MIQEITAMLPPAEQILSVSSLQNSTRATEPHSKKNARSWMPSVQQMPPIAQFILRIVQWCKSKCVAGRKENAPLRLIGQLPLGAKRHLALVEVGGVQFLVGGGAEHVTVIVPVPALTGMNANKESSS